MGCSSSPTSCDEACLWCQGNDDARVVKGPNEFVFGDWNPYMHDVTVDSLSRALSFFVLHAISANSCIFGVAVGMPDYLVKLLSGGSGFRGKSLPLRTHTLIFIVKHRMLKVLIARACLL